DDARQTSTRRKSRCHRRARSEDRGRGQSRHTGPGARGEDRGRGRGRHTWAPSADLGSIRWSGSASLRLLPDVVKQFDPHPSGGPGFVAELAVPSPRRASEQAMMRAWPATGPRPQIGPETVSVGGSPTGHPAGRRGKSSSAPQGVSVRVYGDLATDTYLKRTRGDRVANIGYARCSTLAQDLTAQRQALAALRRPRQPGLPRQGPDRYQPRPARPGPGPGRRPR